LKKYNLCRFL